MSASKEEEAYVPEGASCWICMDDTSQPLVRDCSCRGTSGFAHFFCLAQYAVNKVSDGGDITKPFRECPLCHQDYQHQLAVDMAGIMIQMADQMEDCDPYRYAEALYTKLLSADKAGKDSKDIMKTAHEMIAKLEETDHPSKCASWVMNPVDHADSAKNLMSLAYEKLGWEYVKEGTRTESSKEEASKKFQLAVKHYQKYHDLAKSIGNMAHVKDAEVKIARTKAIDPLDTTEVKHDLKYLRAQHKRNVSKVNTSNLVSALRLEGHEIELERLLAKEIVKNRRLLGPDHPGTQEIELALKGLSVRRLNVRGEDGKFGDDDWRFIRYEDDGKKCVIAPMKSTQDFEGGKDFREGMELAIPTSEMPEKVKLQRGTPVMCVDLAKAAHLNGQMGDARKFIDETQRYEVHFEDKAVTPRSARVKLSNLRIVQELPEE